MQTRMPIGYIMRNGKIEINNEYSPIVKQIYTQYLSGMSLGKIAKELESKHVLTANHNTNWTHGAIGRILENVKYLGDQHYPMLIDKETFDETQKLRTSKETQLGRTIHPNSFANKTIFTNKVICGCCGETYRIYLEHSGKPNRKSKWKCKKYISKNKVNCRNDFYTEDEIKELFISGFNTLLLKQQLLNKQHLKHSPLHSRNLIELNYEITELESTGASTNELLPLLFKRAEMTYENSKIDRYAIDTQTMKDTIVGMTLLHKFDEELFSRLVHKIIIHPENKAEIEFINGLKIPVDK